MICRKCKKEVPDGKFCLECGTKQEEPTRTPKRRGNGQGSAYKRGKTWTAARTRYRNGLRIVEKKGGFTTKKAALEWLAVEEAPTASKITFKQLYDEWSPTHYPNVTKKRRLILEGAYSSCAALHSEYWKDIGIKEMQAVVNSMPENYYPRKNVKSLLNALGEYAIVTGRSDKTFAQYIKLPPEPIPEKTPFTLEEVDLLWADYNSGHDFTGTILIMLYTGMRCGEMMKMNPANIHLDEGYMMGGSKTAAGRAGEIIIIDLIKPLVDKLLLNGGLERTSDTAYRKKFDAALKRAGCRPHTPHECRHTTATLLAKAGVQPAIIQSIMRHTKYSQSAEYTHIDRSTKLAALNQLTKV